MRVRLSLVDPFIPSKILISLPAHVQSISQLKKHLFTSLSSISSVVDSSKEIKLEIDGFELLARSEINVLRDGDITQVSTRSGISTSDQPRASSKRRSTSLDHRERSKRQRRTPSTQSNGVLLPDKRPRAAGKAKPPSPSPSESSSSPSSSSISSSSSSASQAPSSARQPTSYTVHKPDVDPGESSTNPYPVLVNGTLTDQYVPPGHGKAETRDRNARRRRSRQYKRAEADAAGAGPSTVIGLDTPQADQGIGIEAVSRPSADDNDPSDVVARLPNANRNKKKGFFKDMVNQKGVKTTFADDDDDPEGSMANGHLDTTPSAIAATSGSASNRPVTRSQRHSRPPSELPDLPANVFVTSVDYGRPGPSAAHNASSVSATHEISLEDRPGEEIDNAALNEVSLNEYFEGALAEEGGEAPETIKMIAVRIQRAFHAAAFRPITPTVMLEDLRDKYLIWDDVVLIGCSPQTGTFLAKVTEVDPTVEGGQITVHQFTVDEWDNVVTVGSVEEVVLTRAQLLVESSEFSSAFMVIDDINQYLVDGDAVQG